MIWMENGINNRYIALLLLGAMSFMYVSAQTDSLRFDRPSLCLMMIAHPEQAFGNELTVVFKEMDMPERFNDHSLGVRVVKLPNDDPKNMPNNILRFANHAQVAKKMVSKWFNRNKNTGCFDTHMLQERSMYNATAYDLALAEQTVQGKALLADAGEKLINHTFLVMCEYTYDRKYSSQENNTTFSSLKKQNSRTIDLTDEQSVDNYNAYLNQRDNRLERFELSCTSYLFKLDWNDSIANIFYLNYYTHQLDEEKSKAFQQDNTTFTLSYVGCCTNKEIGNNASGDLSNQQLIKQVCIRLRDKNLIALQHAHPEFRIKAPIVTNDPLKVYIGLKEDVRPESRYEVLMPEYTKNGIYKYNRVGVIQPVINKISDNRYSVADDSNPDIEPTTFKQISGGTIYPGMLVREIE